MIESQSEKSLSVRQMWTFLSRIDAKTPYIKGKRAWIVRCLKNSNDATILEEARSSVESLKEHIRNRGATSTIKYCHSDYLK